MSHISWILPLLGISLACAIPASADAPLSLAGPWRYALDRKDEGISQSWFNKNFPDTLNLPGSLDEQGIGDAPSLDTQWTGGIADKSFFTNPRYTPYRQPGNFKIPFWLTPQRYYAGAAWYQREIEIPADWQAKRIVLFLERPHWETRVWLDGNSIGTQNTLGTPHEHDLGLLPPGQHRLTLRVDNRRIIDVGENSHSISDHTQGNWNGIVGRLELRATSPVWIDDLQVYPHLATQSITVKGRLGNATSKLGTNRLTLAVTSRNPDLKLDLPPKTIDVKWDTTGGSFETELPLGPNAQTWDEFSPALYSLRATLADQFDTRTTTFGLRELTTRGTQFILNNHPIFFRGTLECCIFPRTGYPPTDVPSWKRILTIARAHGLNHLRFHSWCPPEAAFIAADEMGFYFQVECSSWANQSTTLGDGKPVDAWLHQEADRILKTLGNHPSFLLMPYGNEPGGKHHKEFLAQWVNHYKSIDPRRLFTTAAGWPELPENQYHCTPHPRVQAWGQGLKSRINAQPPETCTDYRDYIKRSKIPVISHEIGQWCVYPNFDEIPKYTGNLKARNFEIFRDFLTASGMADQARDFLIASGKLQTLCYKEEIESALRTPGMGGFQLLDLHDFPGQGTALVGVLDPFWESKGYVSPEQFSRFCNSTVPLARLKQRIFTADQSFEAQIEIANYSPRQFSQKPTWTLRDTSAKIIASGTLQTIPAPNSLTPVGQINFPLATISQATQLNLEVKIDTFANDWDVWVYPATVPAPASPGLLIADSLTPAALEKLGAGGTVLLLPPPASIRSDSTGRIPPGFSSIFWNTAWTNGQAPHTLGILCNPQHPALSIFPTDSHSNWQWWELLTQSHPFIVTDHRTLKPIVQLIDDWFSARKLALVFEAKVARGKLLACGIDLSTNLDHRPVARQLRASLCAYAASPQFQPRMEMTVPDVEKLFLSSK